MNSASFVLVAFSYLIGSVPFGFLAGRLKGKDLRVEGSGNVGATNAMRVLGPAWGYTVFFLDFAKGALPVFVAQIAGTTELFQILCGISAILGHNFPVWLKFRGGKGIATSGGVILALFGGWVFAISLGSWALVFWLTRYVSVASMAGALALSLALIGFALAGQSSWLLAGVGICMTSLAIWRHKANIRRLLDGTEPRCASRKTSTGTSPRPPVESP